jgi:hypothetical protein
VASKKALEVEQVGDSDNKPRAQKINNLLCGEKFKFMRTKGISSLYRNNNIKN